MQGLALFALSIVLLIWETFKPLYHIVRLVTDLRSLIIEMTEIGLLTMRVWLAGLRERVKKTLDNKKTELDTYERTESKGTSSPNG